MPSREEWLKERQKGIGGSDAAVILGLNPYKTILDFGKKKQEEFKRKIFLINLM